ncbi:MAG TPA: tRNA (adenosine(37)-N6)-threonylcarbamoyltransferase complex ATPase subunit type 1 TsaE [Candidatus Omnitrophota bacterium]|nr:tRNA (adenosine(37)-N6)-threonylcarbamoyltransferase complex ATPase subunit type 1 TsaE [Candidatus Omnitrophota bacterium]
MRIHTHSAAQTRHIGSLIARSLRPGDIVCLSGNLGSGKTVLAKGIASGLGIDKDAVISPTFVIIREYRGRVPLYHFDLYRLENPDDIVSLGYEEYLYGRGVSVIEWSERLGPLMPQEYVGVHVRISGETTRSFEFSARGQRYKEVVKRIYENFSA